MRGPAPSNDGYGAAAEPRWSEIDWASHQRVVVAAERQLNIVEIGSGPPVMLVHGHDGSWRNWLETIPALARSHRVVAPDLPGFGASPLPGERISITGYADTLAALCSTLALERVSLIGNSMGGLVAAELAIRQPEVVERLALVAPAGLSRRYGGLPLWVLASRAMPVRLFARANRSMAARARALAGRRRLRRASLARAVAHPEWIAPAMAAHLIDAAGASGSVPASAAVLSHRIADRLVRIRCPTLVVWGAADAMIAAEAARRWSDLIPHAESVVLPDTGHLPMVERPARFNALLEEFLDGDGAERGA